MSYLKTTQFGSILSVLFLILSYIFAWKLSRRFNELRWWFTEHFSLLFQAKFFVKLFPIAKKKSFEINWNFSSSIICSVIFSFICLWLFSVMFLLFESLVECPCNRSWCKLYFVLSNTMSIFVVSWWILCTCWTLRHMNGNDAFVGVGVGVVWNTQAKEEFAYCSNVLWMSFCFVVDGWKLLFTAQVRVYRCQT